jgi:hypothetical protein
MPLVFAAIGAAPSGASVLQAAPIVVAATAVARLAVGAIHSIVLVRFIWREV